MKQITFQIDDTGKVQVFPFDHTGEMLPEEQKFTEADLDRVQDLLYNIKHYPQFYGITSRDFKNKTPEEKLADFNKAMEVAPGPVAEPEENSNTRLDAVPAPVAIEQESTGATFHIPTEDGNTIEIKD